MKAITNTKRCVAEESPTEPASKVSKVADAATPSTASAHKTPSTDSQSDAQPAAAQTPPAVVLKYAVSTDKGTRTTMEDVHVCLLANNSTSPAAADSHSSMPSVSHFAIYDGHGGANCAHYVSHRLHEAVLTAGLLTRKKAAAVAQQTWQLDVKAAKQAIVKGFTATDDMLLKECAQRNWQDGATAVAVWVVNSDTALVANVGDAKCVLARVSDKAGSSGQLRAVVLTKDHLAMYAGERARIEKAGGHVSSDGRLNGRIQVSRAFGDAQFKGFGSSATPDVMAFSLSSKDRFMLCACDGFWAVMDPQGAVELVQQQLAAGRDEKAVTNKLINEAVIERRCKDNCTVMLLKFDWMHPKQL